MCVLASADSESAAEWGVGEMALVSNPTTRGERSDSQSPRHTRRRLYVTALRPLPGLGLFGCADLFGPMEAEPKSHSADGTSASWNRAGGIVKELLFIM